MYQVRPGRGRSPAVEAMLTKQPPPWRRNTGTACLGAPVDRLDVDREHPVVGRLVDLEHRLVAMGDAGVVDHDVEPAEGVQRLLAPCARSPAPWRRRRPRPARRLPISPATRSARAPSMSATSTLAPSAAIQLGDALAEAEPAPVTIATLSSSRIAVLPCPGRRYKPAGRPVKRRPPQPGRSRPYCGQRRQPGRGNRGRRGQNLRVPRLQRVAGVAAGPGGLGPHLPAVRCQRPRRRPVRASVRDVDRCAQAPTAQGRTRLAGPAHQHDLNTKHRDFSGLAAITRF